METIGDMGKTGKLVMKCKASEGTEIYEVRKEDDKYTCTCLGYGTSKRRPKMCKHIRRYHLITMLEALLLKGGDIEKCAIEIETLFKKEV